MIIGKIIQKGLLISLKDTVNTFQYSANLRMQFVKDENFKDYILTGYYKTFGENKPKLLEIDEHGYFYLGKDIFLNAGTVQFSFSLNHVEGKIIHLGIVEYIVERAFGSDKEVLPEDEEIWVTIVKNAAKDTIKDDVELVKQKANEALQSASLANEKVSEAQKYANNANQSASSVLTAKNDAIAASSSAIQAKKDAEQSANNAKDSANTALENANRSSEAIATATQIETEIENKANDFDKKVETANSTFDEKVSNANKEIDPKVQEVIKQAQKAKDEADRATQVTDSKLDKNLGAENCDKVLITDTEGNIITQNKKDFEGSGTSDFNDLENKPQINGIELKSNKTSSDLKMYTQEEVDYLLNDKMDKPYTSVTIGEDTVLNDCLDGNLKVDSIYGNTFQNVEENILPTPQRPVPIISRKVSADGDYVELRSLKETINKFDLGLLSQTDLISQTGSYRKIKIPVKLKPNTKYKIYYEKSMIPALTWAVLNIVSTNEILIALLNVNNKENNEVETKAINVAFVSPDNGEIYFDYYVAEYNIEDGSIKQSKEIFKEKWFTKIIKNIMITEDSLNQSTYVPPTVRDYKIVDHVNKTSRIVRNVGVEKLNKDSGFFVNGTESKGYRLIKTNFTESPWVESINDNYMGLSNMCEQHNQTIVNDTLNGSGFFVAGNGKNIYIKLEKYQNISVLEDYLKALGDNEIIFQGQLVTPIEETIPYIETDTSEAGYSWQDLASPSPTVPSEVKGVDKINIRTSGQHINITLPQPLYQNDIANVESRDYEYEKQKYVVTGEELFLNDYQGQSGYYGRYFNLRNGVQDRSGKCNYLPYFGSVWSNAMEGFCQNANTQIHLKFSNDRLGIKDDMPVEEKRLAFANYLKQLYASGYPLYVVVKVAKTTQAIPPEDLAKLKSLKTNSGINNIFINGEVKPVIEARYPQDVLTIVNRLESRLLTLQEEAVKNV